MLSECWTVKPLVDASCRQQAWLLDRKLHRLVAAVYKQTVAGREVSIPCEGPESGINGASALRLQLASS